MNSGNSNAVDLESTAAAHQVLLARAHSTTARGDIHRIVPSNLIELHPAPYFEDLLSEIEFQIRRYKTTAASADDVAWQIIFVAGDLVKMTLSGKLA